MHMPHRKNWHLLLVLALSLFMVGACAPARASGFVDNGWLHVMTTTGMLADAVRQVGGEMVPVIALMGSGTGLFANPASLRLDERGVGHDSGRVRPCQLDSCGGVDDCAASRDVSTHRQPVGDVGARISHWGVFGRGRLLAGTLAG